MKRALLRNVNLYTRNLLRNPNLSPSLAPLAASTRPRLRFYSSGEKPSSAPETSLAQPQKNDAPIAVEDASGKNSSSAPETSLVQTQKKDALIAVEDVNNKGRTKLKSCSVWLLRKLKKSKMKIKIGCSYLIFQYSFCLSFKEFLRNVRRLSM
jgi:hypothetical protein